MQPAATISALASVAEVQEGTVALLQEKISPLKNELGMEKKHVDALKKQMRFWKNKAQSPLNDLQSLSSSTSETPVFPLSRYHLDLF